MSEGGSKFLQLRTGGASMMLGGGGGALTYIFFLVRTRSKIAQGDIKSTMQKINGASFINLV